VLKSERDQIFISYSHKDQQWLERLQKHLRPLIPQGELSIWDDTKIQPGDSWRDEFENALAAARVAVLLVSPDYLASDFILKNELPSLLEAAGKDGLIILWIAVRASSFQETEIARFQAANDPLKPLANLKSAARDEQLVKICKQIVSAVKSASLRPPNQLESEDSTIAPEAEKNVVLKRGSKVAAVLELQQKLNQVGHNVGTADGIFGPKTESALKHFQRSRGLTADGIAGPNTLSELAQAASAGGSEVPQRPPSPAVDQILKEGLANGASEQNAINDKPLDDVKEDTLGFADYVFALRDFIASQETSTPLTISINGAWGSGKSSLMRMLQNELDRGPQKSLWLIKLRWLTRWLEGTFFCFVGWFLMKLSDEMSPFIGLGLGFDVKVDVNEENFDEIFKRYIEASIASDFPQREKQESARSLADWHYVERLKRSRFWAWKSAKRRKMVPQRYPAIWFNAWKFGQQEQLWSALALAVLDQLRKRYGFASRLLFLTQLTLRRLDKIETVRHIFQKLLLPLILAALVAVYYLCKDRFGLYVPSALGFQDKWVWLAPVLAAVWQAWKEIDNPFQLPIEKILERPDYKQKVGFIGTFEEDFGRIVEVAIRNSFFWKPRKLVIFIDDLDRCSPVQAAGIIEAINLFLDSVGCVFVLGMDMAVVATSIEVKYKKLTKRMRQEAPGLLSPGSLFLDKIVQIPFNVPRPNRDYMKDVVTTITGASSWTIPRLKWSRTPFDRRPLQQTSGSGPKVSSGSPELGEMAKTVETRDQSMVDRASFAREDIRQAIVFAVKLLKENPRQLKRFVNLFRLHIYIANHRNLLSDNPDFGLTPKLLAVWVAWYMQWPEMIKLLSSPLESLELCKLLRDVSLNLEIKGLLDDQDVEWNTTGKNGAGYSKGLKIIHDIESDTTLYWSKLPWSFWIRDSDFLRCIKCLERYWIRPDLLDSLLDMTQVTLPDSTDKPGTNK
jgi:KAP family P-loop domain/Putative peptidoglycan binding domain/TIR domain